jgi:hypothetical protein
MSVTTSTSVVLEETSMTRNVDAYAERSGLALRCYLATHPDGAQEYVLVENGEAVYANTNIEFIGARIDALALVERFAKD